MYQLDLAKIATFDYTPTGILRVRGTVAKVGDLIYEQADGSFVTQYVPPETLFDEEHLDSIGGAPLTLGHPPERVTPKNYRDYAVGSVGEKIIAHVGQGLIEVTFFVGDETAIKAITSGDAKEISMGYNVLLEPTEDPKRFIQKKRIADHIAAVTYGRAGNTVAFKIDNKDSLLSYPRYPEENKVKTTEMSKEQKFDNINTANSTDKQKWQILTVTM